MIRSPWLHTLVAACLFSGCAEAITPAFGPRFTSTPPSTSPWPSAWGAPEAPSTRPGTQARWHSPLWGVPRFEPPSATHCARQPTLTETGSRGLFQRERLESRAAPHAAPHPARPTAPAVSAAGAATADMAPETRSHDKARRDSAYEPAAAAPMVQSQAVRPREPVTAGMVDDNADFSSYLSFVRRQRDPLLRQRDMAERYRVQVLDAEGRGVVDAEVAFSWPGARASQLWARTDAQGQAWLHPGALIEPQQLGRLDQLELQARSPSGELGRATLTRGQKHGVSIPLAAASTSDRAERRDQAVPLDLVFVVDATGSMGDEIDKLRQSMQSIADRIARVPGGVDLCLGLVAYRDQGDEYLTRRYELTNQLPAFQQVLGSLRAAGGGDEPEALNEALDEAVHRMAWRQAGTTRLAVVLGDAPPQMDRAVAYYDEAAQAALARGIKLHTVGASGLNKRGEATFRHLAQSTGGRFVFLTYQDAKQPGRAPGSETTHDVRNYSVSTLDDLVVRLVQDELAARR